MVSDRIWTIINTALVFISLLLILNLLDIQLPTLGQALYSLDKTDPLCVVNWKDDFNTLDDLDRCCLEARKQLECVRGEKNLEQGKVRWVCQTGNSVKYWLNSKAYGYCRQQDIWL